MTTVICYVAMSLDGFIAREDGRVDWLDCVDQEGQDYGYSAFYEPLDALVMGRLTYDQVLTFGDWPYPGKTTYILSRQPGNCKTDSEEPLSFVNENQLWAALEQHQRVWLVGGAETVACFRQRRAIDEWRISIIPVLLGRGLPLFTDREERESLTLKSSQSYDTGLVQLYYQRALS